MFAVLSANIQGLCPSKGKFKLDMLNEISIEEKVGIIALTESHLNSKYHEGEISINNFNHYRTDRSEGKRGGGVIVYVRNELSPGIEVLMSESIENIELLVLNIKAINLVLVTIYRPPNAQTEALLEVLSKIKQCLSNQFPSTHTLALCGDLNFPIINWQTNTIHGGSGPSRQQASALLNFFEDFFLQQYVEEPTRAKSVLDLFASDDDQLVLRVKVMSKSKISDHNLIIVNTTQYLEPPINQKIPQDESLFSLDFWNYNVQWDKIREKFAGYDWDTLFTNLNPNDIYEKLCSIINDVSFRNVPKKRIWKGKDIPRDRRILMRRRSKLNKKLPTLMCERSKNNVHSELIKIDDKIVASHVAELAKMESKAVNKIKNDPKYFYKYAKSKSKARSNIGPLIVNDILVTDPHKMSEALKSQFESVFSIPTNSANINELENEPGPRCLEDFSFNEEDIHRTIELIPAHSAAGPDGIPAKLLKECAGELKTPIYILWRKSLDLGQFPSKLKNSIVVPVHKKGDRSLPKNYRPISLTSHLSKIFERVVVAVLTDYLNSMDLFNSQQHGFRSGRSCLSQLLEHHQKILAYLESGADVDVVYLDFAKAFDKVDYGILMAKLKAIGVGGLLLRLLCSFLTDRSQTVSVEGSLSHEGPVLSGVPQGSSLGPLLFLLHIADIDAGMDHASASSFADDTRITMSIRKPEDCAKMQSDLEKVYGWAEENNMSFNADKFEVLSYRATSLQHMPYQTPTGTNINESESLKDLGIIMENTGSFKLQIAESVKRSSNIASWILRVFKTREHKPLMTLYNSMVVPHIEYCCQLWSPSLLGDIRKLEAVQRSFTSRISGLGHLSYWDRLQHLQLYSLERRRERYIVMYIFKIIQGIVPNLADERFAIQVHSSVSGNRLCRVPAFSTGSTAKIRNYVENSFAVQGPKLFNSLPVNLRNFQGSFPAFKNRFDNFLSVINDKPCTPGYHQSAASNSIISQLAQMRADGIFL